MPRLRSAGALEHHRPRRVADAAPQFLVDEIADPPGAETERTERCGKIGHGEETALGTPRVVPHRGDDAEEPAMERHATVPQREYLQRMLREVNEVIEEHVAQAAAENDAERDVEEHVAHFGFLPTGIRASGAIHPQRPAARETDEVHNSVPMDFDGTERER